MNYQHLSPTEKSDYLLDALHLMQEMTYAFQAGDPVGWETRRLRMLATVEALHAYKQAQIQAKNQPSSANPVAAYQGNLTIDDEWQRYLQPLRELTFATAPEGMVDPNIASSLVWELQAIGFLPGPNNPSMK